MEKNNNIWKWGREHGPEAGGLLEGSLPYNHDPSFFFFLRLQTYGVSGHAL